MNFLIFFEVLLQAPQLTSPGVNPHSIQTHESRFVGFLVQKRTSIFKLVAPRCKYRRKKSL